MKYLLIQAGCAECRFGLDESIISFEGPFDSLEEAKVASMNPEGPWRDHPEGGIFAADGQGDDWIISLEDLKEKKQGDTHAG